MGNLSPAHSTRVWAIVPCYNEAPRIQVVLDALLQIKLLEAIIVIDDGSSDGSARVVARKIAERETQPRCGPRIQLLVRANNLGKSAAVLLGVLQASRAENPPEYLLLVDADLRALQPCELELAIMTVLSDPAIDMLILRRVKKDCLTRLLGGDLLISGERLIRRTDLLEVLTHDPVSGFQLEVAINQYMLDQAKNVRWLPISSTGVISLAKLGVFNGISKEFSMFSCLFAYLGLRKAWQQMVGLRQVPRAATIES